GRGEAPERGKAHREIRRDARVHEERRERLEQRELLWVQERRAEDRQLGMQQVDARVAIDERGVRRPGLPEAVLLEQGLTEARQPCREREGDRGDDQRGGSHGGGASRSPSTTISGAPSQ